MAVPLVYRLREAETTISFLRTVVEHMGPDDVSWPSVRPILLDALSPNPTQPDRKATA